MLAVEGFYDDATSTVTYLVWDEGSKAAAIIDPVMDYDQSSSSLATTSADQLLGVAAEKNLTIEWVLETHVHADHLSAGDYIRQKTGAKIGIGARIAEVQSQFYPLFHALDVEPDGSVFDALFEDGDTLPIGGLTVEVMHTPGHTPACVTYKIKDALFVGDTLFMPDFGTARADFPGGDAHVLYQSIHPSPFGAAGGHSDFRWS
jgi:glyoxylase-like metal-dependent hydrolase (beta-lactamase superfamily II)